MDRAAIAQKLDQSGDVIRLGPQIVGRFYGDGNRLGQRPAGSRRRPRYYKPERWIGSSTPAANPPGIPPGGISTCPDLSDSGRLTLKSLLAHRELGPRLLGQERFDKHGGTFRVLIKLLDPACPIPFHVHADDRFVSSHREVYPDQTFGKDEAYHFLAGPKGPNSYTHAGVYPGVGPREVVTAMRKGTDWVMELTPGAMQNFHEGFIVKAGMLHRPGTAITLEIQQPSDVYTFFQTDFGGAPLPEDVLYPGFKSIEEAAEQVVNWQDNLKPNLLETLRLKPTPVQPWNGGGQAHWVYPPEATDKFSGMRLTVDTTMKFQARQPCVLFVWKGKGTLDGRAIDGGGGPTGAADEFFLGASAAVRGIEFVNTGGEPLIVFALFAASV